MTSDDRSSVRAEPDEITFCRLVERVAACRLCPSMEGRRRVLGPGNGSLDALVLFVAEAPGRLGGDRTGVPLSRDRSGQNFERLLASSGLGRAEVFVTNAVLCNPRDARGRNRPPRLDEQSRCLPHLRAQLDLIRAPIVATLGAVALRALDRIEPHEIVLREQVGRAISWRGRLLFPLYHPSGQAMLTRSFACQQQDYRALGELVRSVRVTIS